MGFTVLLVGVLAPGCARSFCDVSLGFSSFHSFSFVSLASGLDVLADPFHVYEITVLDAFVFAASFCYLSREFVSFRLF